MEKIKLLKNMIASNKKTFHYTFKMMVSLQDQIENMIIPFLEQYQMPSEEKKGISEWIHSSKKKRDSYQKMIEDGFGTLESHF